jgi:hypothetical protein
VREKGFSALKTNIFIYENGRPQGWRPGFSRPFYPELNVDKKVLRNLRIHLEALDDGAGPDVDLLLDLNFNAKTESYLKILRGIAHFDMFWIEIDTYSAEALGYIRRSRRTRFHRARRCSGCASSCPISASRRWTWQSSTRCGTVCGSR